MTTTPDQAGRGLSDYDKGREWSQRGWGAPEAGPSDEFYRGYEDAKAGRSLSSTEEAAMSGECHRSACPTHPDHWRYADSKGLLRCSACDGAACCDHERDALQREVEAMHGYKPCRCGRTGRWAHKPTSECPDV